VQCPIVLKHLYKAGIHGKAWRLTRVWYSEARHRVRVGGLST